MPQVSTRRSCRRQQCRRPQMERQRREVKMERLKSQSVRFMLLTFAGLALVSIPVEPSQAQQKPDAQLERAVTEYKSKLEQLLHIYERDSKQSEERLSMVRELLAQGLVTRRDVETAEDA